MNTPLVSPWILSSPTFLSISSGLEKSDEVVLQTKNLVSQLCSENNKNIVLAAVQKYVKSRFLIDIISKHPTLWMHLIRMIHANVVHNVSEWSYTVPENKHSKIKSLLLTRDRESDIGEDANMATESIDKEILENQDFLKFCSEQWSPLDIGSDIFDIVDPSQQKGMIQWLILRWMIDNVEGCTFKLRHKYFPQISTKIASYLPLVFPLHSDIYRELGAISNYDDFINKIMSELRNTGSVNYATKRINILRYIKAFHAWWDIENIEKAQKNAVEYAQIDNMKLLLKKARIPLHEPLEFSEDGITQYKGKVTIEGKKYEIRWRAKSLVSILKKLWEIEEYTNIDALRDTLGISIIPPDNADDNEIRTIVDKVSQIMPNYGYMIKLKWLLANYTPKNWSRVKKPLTITTEKEDKTNPHLNNVSVQGYVKLDKLEHACWGEVQVIKESNFLWKKKEDHFYKIIWDLDLICRWEHFISPWYLMLFLDEIVSHLKLEKISTALSETTKVEISIPNIRQLLLFLIQKGKISMFTNKHGELLLVPKKYISKFKKSRGDYWTKLDYEASKESIDKFIWEIQYS